MKGKEVPLYDLHRNSHLGFVNHNNDEHEFLDDTNSCDLPINQEGYCITKSLAKEKCKIDPRSQIFCQFCRFNKYIEFGMMPELLLTGKQTSS